MLPQLVDAGVEGRRGEFRRFRVASGGSFNGRSFDEGDVLLCVGDDREASLVVVTPTGFGRPRLSRRRGTRLAGEHGETLHDQRWVSVGRLYAVRPRSSPSPVFFGQLALFAS